MVDPLLYSTVWTSSFPILLNTLSFTVLYFCCHFSSTISLPCNLRYVNKTLTKQNKTKQKNIGSSCHCNLTDGPTGSCHSNELSSKTPWLANRYYSPFSDSLTSIFFLEFIRNEPLGGDSPPGVAATAEVVTAAQLSAANTQAKRLASAENSSVCERINGTFTGTQGAVSTMGKGGGTFDRLLGTFAQHLLVLMAC